MGCPPRITTAELRTSGAAVSRQAYDSPTGLGGAYTRPR